MALTNIEYGSMASSEVLNANFNFLDTKIATTASGINSSISSIQSNIATINSRLTELAGGLSDLTSDISANLSELKTKTISAINKICMLPKWSDTESIESLSSYNVTGNGYILALPQSNANGNFIINGVTVSVKQVSASGDNAKEIIVIPVKKNDIITSEITLSAIYFVPVALILSDEF
ncbi:MAG: hypothetical protein MJ237_07500 [bacterium]|nr:hypothetical protein [bacterium]